MIKSAQDPHHGMFITSEINKEIMSKIRQKMKKGDHQHPGGDDAIKIVFQQIKKDPKQLLLDVGCGRGGTARYLTEHGWGDVIGIDANANIIAAANELNLNKRLKKSPVFIHADVENIQKVIFEKNIKDVYFDIIYLFNSFFLFPDQLEALKSLRNITKEDTQLIIFDYVNLGSYDPNSYTENGKVLLPNCIYLSDIEKIFKKSGWQAKEINDFTSLYIIWYQELISAIQSSKNMLLKEYNKKIFGCFKARYQHILDALKNHQLGAVAINAIPLEK